MKALILFGLVLVSVVALRAGDTAPVTSVRAADDARVAAMAAVDYAGLNATLSDELHYSHSDKLVETKAEFIDRLVSRRGIYRRIDYKKRDFTIVAPGVVLVTGRAEVEVGGKRMMFLADIKFTAVWRLEDGEHWRLFAWQSTHMDEIVPLGPPSEDQPNKPVQINAVDAPRNVIAVTAILRSPRRV